MLRRKRGRVRLGERRKKILLAKVFLGFITSILIIALFRWVTQAPQINIDTLQVSGNIVTASESLREIAWDELSGKYVWLIPRSNIFFYPRRAISSRVIELLPRIKEASVSFVNFHTALIKVRERVPFGLWCGVTEKPVPQETTQCFYLDKEGYLFAKSPNFSGDVFFRYYGPLEDTFAATGPLRAQYLPVNRFLGYSLFLDALRDLQVNPVALVRDEASDLHLKLEGGAVLIFSTDQNLNTILENLRSILDSDTFSKKGMDNLEYIDLRFGNKVFYKTK